MKRRLYPAVLERGPKGTFGAWFPDFPGCVAGGKSQEEAIERAENALAQAVDGMAEHERPLLQPTPIERIALPKGCDFVAYFIVGVDPPVYGLVAVGPVVCRLSFAVMLPAG